MLDKICSNEKVRKELQIGAQRGPGQGKKGGVEDPAAQGLQVSSHPGKSHRLHGRRENMIFITEGQSAAGSIVSSRDPMTQAVFSLKGKPMNVLGQKMALLYKNEEMYSLMRALDIEDSISNLRYDKVILATDADVDGLHIRNLLLTFFLHYFEPLVKLGHIYILETPIFRVRNQGRDRSTATREKEKIAATQKLQGRRQRQNQRGNHPI